MEAFFYKVMTIGLLLCCISIISEASNTIIVDEKDYEKTSWIEEGLMSKISVESNSTERKIVTQRKAVIKRLMEVVEREPVGSIGGFKSRTLAIKMLGEYRAIEAVDLLLKLITYEDKPLVIDNILTKEQAYPAVSALIAIGIPAANKTLIHLQNSGDPKEIWLCSFIIKCVYGKDVAVFVVQQQITKSMYEHNKKNLQEALDKWLLPGKE